MAHLAFTNHCTTGSAHQHPTDAQPISFCRAETPLNPSHIRDALTQLLQQAHLPPIRFHDLRHSTATFLLSLGVHPKVVQEILGHSQISMTLDIYSHVLPTMQKEAMDRLSKALQEEETDAPEE